MSSKKLEFIVEITEKGAKISLGMQDFNRLEALACVELLRDELKTTYDRRDEALKKDKNNEPK